MIFARPAACLVLCVSLLSSTAALAMSKTIVVLPLDIARAGGKMSVDARISVEEMIRDEAVDALAGTGWTVLSGETTLKKLKDNGIDPTKCDDQGCHLETAQNMTVPMFISGSVQYVEGTFTASIRLIETATGKQLAATHFESTRVLGLRSEFSKAAPEFFRKAGLAAGDDGATNAPAATNPGRVVEVGNPPRAGPAAQGTIKVVSSPSGAKVSVDGDAAGSTPVTVKRDAGTYVVTIELPGYAPASRQVDVAGGKTALVNESLMQAAGYLDVAVAPDEAARTVNVTVDGQPAGVGKQGPYKVGKHTVRAEASGYKPAEQTVGVDNGGTASVSLVLEALPGKLLLSVNVAAQCSAGGARVEATPDGMVKLEVPAGAARVTCSAEGHEDASADVTVGAGRAQAVKLTLKRGASGAAGVDAKSGVTFIALPGGTLQLDGGTFNGTRVAPFKLARTATTVAQYKKCVDAGGCSEPKTGGNCNWGTDRNDHPVNCVDWDQATAFCKWMGARLPTAEEREWAASSGEGRTYPWGNEPPGAKACWDGEGSDVGKGNRKTTCVAGSHPAGASKQGVQDLAGNVWEWLSNDYNGGKEIRGGSWNFDYAGFLRASYRDRYAPSGTYSSVGFRCGL